VTNDIPLGCSLLLLVDTVNCVQTLKAMAKAGGDPTYDVGASGGAPTAGYARCAFFDRTLHSMMTLVPPPAHFKSSEQACDQ
jgi:hypothetical protein